MKRPLSILFLLLLVCAASIFVGCKSGVAAGDLTQREKQIISNSAEVMYVLDLSNKDDEAVLRTPSEYFSIATLKSEEFKTLSRKMMATVQSEQQGGVGIAAPQVGINKKVIIVCRTDKDGEPFEVYPNIDIIDYQGEQVGGPEGCLSVPPYRGTVKRYQHITISYINPSTYEKVEEDVEGYAAVIFQHECDHLQGVLYVDRADTVYVNDSWKQERLQYSEQGLYTKPSWEEEILK